MKKVLLFLQQDERQVSSATRKVYKSEELKPLASTNAAVALSRLKRPNGVVIVVSREGDWSVVGVHGEPLDVELASAIAGESGGTGWIYEPVRRNKVSLWPVTQGQRAEVPQFMTEEKACSYLKTAGVADRLLGFVPEEHLKKESTKLGKHADTVLGFERNPATDAKVGAKEVKAALAEKPLVRKVKTLTLEQFLAKAIKHKGVRAIAKAQIEEQLKRDDFDKALLIYNPVAEGHYCEAFDAESYSFTSNGPYVWFDWFCEEACQPELTVEKAFPSCDLSFRLLESEEL
ncbi:MAG: hypothetical protein V1895_02565 [Parcubacteria group bacterium]